jgi:hypothetical protein
VSLPQRDERVDDDPLLEFSIEPGTASIPPTQPDQPVAASGVPAPAPSGASSPDHDAVLRARIDHLEKALDRSVQEVASLRSEVATLVSVKGDINKRPATPVKPPIKITPPRTHSRSYPALDVSTQSGSGPNHVLRRVVGATAGIAIGVAMGMWIWTSMSTDPLIPAAPIRTTATEPIAVSPDPPAVDTPAAIVPAASVTPVRTPPPRESSRTSDEESNRPINYVGTLSIDSDPPGEVFIDRKAVGRTPLMAPNLKAGSHLIWIERDGYRRFTRVVEVPADRISRVVADLESVSQR